MKISLEWLAEYLPGKTDLHSAADCLTMAGLPTENFFKVGADDVMDVEVTSNRGDCLSHYGIARELSALLGRELRFPAVNLQQGAVPASSEIAVAIEAAELCPHYTARVIKGVKVGPSPDWMKRRLEAIGLRSINNIVDITNYVMFEMGQPLHAFDLDHVQGKKIIVRNARNGEKLISIDGHERKLSPDMLVIADANRPVALAGVMGGKESEVSDKTVNILLESARFEPLCVRRTARKLAMMSDSSYRFERSIDPTLPARASARAAQLIVELAGGQLLSGAVEAGSGSAAVKKISVRLSRIHRILGVEFPVQWMLNALKRLQFDPVQHGEQIDVTVPSHRLDVNIEVDLIEEIARVVGYEKVPMRDQIQIRVVPPAAEAQALNVVHDVLAAAGYSEAVTFSFASDVLAGDFKPADAQGLVRVDEFVRKSDANLRPSIIPGLLEAVRRNEAAGTAGARLYEAGSVFWHSPARELVEKRKLALVGSSELREVRGVVESILARLNRNLAVSVVPDKRAGFSTAACGRIEWNGEPVGYIGKVDRAIAEKLSMRDIPAAAEIDLPAVLKHAQPIPQLQALPKFPCVRRDLSLVVNETTRFESIDSLVRDLKLSYMENLEFVTTYRGKPLEKSQKSITISIIFRSPSATLTSEEVEQSVQRVITEARAKLGATLRE